MFKRIVISILALCLFANVGIAQNETNFDRIQLDKSDATYGDLMFKNGEFITNDTDGTLNFGAAILVSSGAIVWTGDIITSAKLAIGLTAIGTAHVTVDGQKGTVDLARFINDSDGAVGDSSLVINKYAQIIGTGVGAVTNNSLADSLDVTGDVNATTITATTGIVPDAQDGAYLGTNALQFSDLFLADAAVIAFGDDGDVTLTHVADTGLLLTDNSGVGTTELQFGDDGTYVYQVSDGILGLVADTEVDITVTDLDVNAAVSISGLTTHTTGIVAAAQDGAYLGTSSLQFSDLFLADGAKIEFGDDGDVTITHIADTGILLSDESGIGTTQLQFGDAGTYVYQVSDGILGLVADTEVDITVTTLDINGLANISGALTVGGILDGNGAEAALNNTLADTLDITGELTATTIVTTGSITDGTMTIDGTGGFSGVAALTMTGDLTLSSGRVVQSGTGATTNNTFADSVDVTGEITATTAIVSGVITSTGGVDFATETPVIWTTGGSPGAFLDADSIGTDTAPTDGPRWWTEIMIPYNVTLTGGFYLVGSTGGTDSVMIELFDASGTLVADNVDDHVNEPAAIVGTANQFQKVAFESSYNAVAGKYYLCVSFNGTTARFKTYAITGSPFVAATVGGTWKTSASITPGTTFTADKGPIGGVY